MILCKFKSAKPNKQTKMQKKNCLSNFSWYNRKRIELFWNNGTFKHNKETVRKYAVLSVYQDLKNINAIKI